MAELYRAKFPKLRKVTGSEGKSRRSGVAYAVVHRFIGGDRSINLGTASKLAAVLNLELRPAQRTKE